MSACELCNGSGRVAVGPWGVRPPTVTCELCDGRGIHFPQHFTSGKISHDSEPWESEGIRSREQWLKSATYAPRPEFDNHNPILARFRKFVEGENQSDPYFSEHWLDALTAYDLFGDYTGWYNADHRFHVIIAATDAQRYHARRVLTKLAALS